MQTEKQRPDKRSSKLARSPSTTDLVIGIIFPVTVAGSCLYLLFEAWNSGGIPAFSSRSTGQAIDAGSPAGRWSVFMFAAAFVAAIRLAFQANKERRDR